MFLRIIENIGADTHAKHIITKAKKNIAIKSDSVTDMF